MAKFVYRMQSILNIKEKMEEQAKQAFAAAIDPFAQQQTAEPPKVEEKRYKTRFYAKGTRAQLEMLIQFMNDNGIEYGRIKA